MSQTDSRPEAPVNQLPDVQQKLSNIAVKQEAALDLRMHASGGSSTELRLYQHPAGWVIAQRDTSSFSSGDWTITHTGARLDVSAGRHTAEQDADRFEELLRNIRTCLEPQYRSTAGAAAVVTYADWGEFTVRVRD
ncbi:hypothetical protein C475_08967 [Halosimplex carlsbadense 2-9-1]|uniref:Uncharacterized protein n=1 Tax=Halosimplex carlsbadense 2-9-1 TaxID=797114 RepID=M0CTI0_9EURY|nr:hypothetical protein [Halosimplex carlsbadense]ELZ26545.1 hypothetical protein C475_08967 [Halosimplex carlsbadense 2-9-1]